MNIAITGASGFLGGNLKPYLGENFKSILSISRNPNGENVKTYADSSIWESNDVFIHLAGKAHDLKNTSEESEYFEVNSELTKELFDAFLKSNSKVFVFMSSVKAAADEVEGVLEETVNPNPITAYGKSKLEAEQYILSHKLPENKRVYILRPCMIHGPNNKGNLNLLFGFVKKGFPYPFGSYKNQRSFVSVDNLCFIINELILNKNIPSGIYNVADETPMSTENLVKVIGEVLGKPARILNVPTGIMNAIAVIGGVLGLPINKERLQKLTENYVVSNTKIKNAIGKEFPLTTKEGIEKTISSFI